ncbi:DNA starvation/stationary phase protection protein [Geothrix limicola]|uniref:DNA starvation/stationary phase protection protein n=1 Tax=Geothrix limicola TaxID=2927978 RepID=A0ABQ5QIE9_9BACT|nr:DNA starvation/stationary phase protection protein [Geothrix limicola]GLH74326.1 DNA starvation/stationary phase protection protein [Geothrix limicola]
MNHAVTDHLNVELATAFVLALNAKRYHWTVSGPHFRDYHLRFEDLYAAADGTVDELAERIRMLGGVPLHTPSQIEARTKAAISNPALQMSPHTMLKEALGNEEATIALMHEGIELANGAGDPGTADLLTRFVQVHQKEAWFLREMLG